MCITLQALTNLVCMLSNIHTVYTKSITVSSVGVRVRVCVMKERVLPIFPCYMLCTYGALINHDVIKACDNRVPVPLPVGASGIPMEAHR